MDRTDKNQKFKKALHYDLLLYRLMSFSFYAVTFGDEQKRYVSEIVELKELLEEKAYRQRLEGPLWILWTRTPLTIWLNNSD